MRVKPTFGYRETPFLAWGQGEEANQLFILAGGNYLTPDEAREFAAQAARLADLLPRLADAAEHKGPIPPECVEPAERHYFDELEKFARTEGLRLQYADAPL